MAERRHRPALLPSFRDAPFRRGPAMTAYIDGCYGSTFGFDSPSLSKVFSESANALS
jgi:hypothetical protein